MIDKEIGRRGLLGLLAAAAGGAVVAPTDAASGIGVKAAAAALGVDPNPTGGDLLEGCMGTSSPVGGYPGWRIANLIDHRAHAQRAKVSDMPPHISEKKSWSRSYKAMIHSREQVVLRAYLDRLSHDSGTERAFLSLLGIDPGDSHVESR